MLIFLQCGPGLSFKLQSIKKVVAIHRLVCFLVTCEKTQKKHTTVKNYILREIVCKLLCM